MKAAFQIDHNPVQIRSPVTERLRDIRDEYGSL